MNCILRCYDAREALKHGKKITAIQKAILVVSDPLVHTEFQFSRRHSNISHSSTLQGKDNGTRFEQIDYTKHPERWLNLVLPMSNSQEERAWQKANEINGKPYDKIGVLSLSSKYDVIQPDPDKYWCSEACAELIKAAYGYGDDFKPDTFAPLQLFMEMYRRLYSDAIPLF